MILKNNVLKMSQNINILFKSFVNDIIKVFPEYSDMSQAKAMLESIGRNYGYKFSKKRKIRVNTISQSPTITTSGKGIKKFNKIYQYTNKISPLGNANTLDCANFIIFMFSSLSKMITMQNLMHDGGFSNCGIIR